MPASASNLPPLRPPPPRRGGSPCRPLASPFWTFFCSDPLLMYLLATKKFSLLPLGFNRFLNFFVFGFH